MAVTLRFTRYFIFEGKKALELVFDIDVGLSVGV